MRYAPLVLFAWMLAGCGDDRASGGGGAGGTGASGPGGGGSGASGSGGSGTGAGGAGVGGGGTGGAPPCTADTLAEAVRVTPLTVGDAVAGHVVTAEHPGGSVVAWAAADGQVHARVLDAVDLPMGNELAVAGTEVFGAAVSGGDIGLLVARAPDFMTFVRLEASGAVLSETNLVGGGDHQQVGVEWFGEFATTGRLVARGDGTWAAYHALHRRWPDMIGHQGDTLRLLGANGAPLGGGWGWGCSHSMDQRLATGPNGLVPVCISDCYPTPAGIWFSHDAAQITQDPGANCAGGYTTALGGLVATAEGFSLVYQDASGGAHLGRFDPSGQPIADVSLSVPGSSRLAAFDGGLLLGSPGGGDTQLQRIDATGALVGEPATVSVGLPAQDFESRSDGEVAWAVASASGVDVVRVRVCR